jgi:hypothetical protein
MDQREHELRVTAEGFAPVTRQLRFDADFDLELTLAPVQAVERTQPGAGSNADGRPGDAVQGRVEARPEKKPVSSPKRTAAPARAASARAAARNTAAARRVMQEKLIQEDDCDPPYVVNELGVKRYKRECLK